MSTIYLGTAQIAIEPLALKQALWGTLFSDRFEQICQITVLTVQSVTKHPGSLNTLQQKQMHNWT